MDSGPFKVLRRQTNRLGSGLEARVPALPQTRDEPLEHTGTGQQHLLRQHPAGRSIEQIAWPVRPVQHCAYSQRASAKPAFRSVSAR